MTPDPLLAALKALNNAAYEALTLAQDTTRHPHLDRWTLCQIAAFSDRLIEDYSKEIHSER